MTEPGSDKQRRVLVADDDPDVLELVTFRLRHSGYEVLRARNGEEALDVVERESPDLAIIDVMMPKLDGLSVTRRLREREKTKDIPIILLTARVQESDVTRGMDAGADDYVTKPFSPQELYTRVQAILDTR